MNTEENKAVSDTAQVVSKLTKEFYATERLSLSSEGHDILVLPKGKEIKSIKPFLDEYRAQPERRKGTAALLDLESFIKHVNRFKDKDSALFANNSRTEPSITSVYDYHEAGEYAVAAPRFGQHRGVYKFPLSDEWNTWQKFAGSKNAMSQKDFAAFLENQIADVVPAQDNILNQNIKDLVDLLGGDFASPSTLINLSRGMEVNEGMKVKQNVNLSTGETVLHYTSEHQDASGAPLKVPNFFLIAIPVFVNGDRWQIAVRLRYRIASGSIVWFYDLYRDDKVFETAFEEAVLKTAEKTGVPLFIGTPE